MLDSFIAVQQTPRIVNDCFQILLVNVLFITLFSFAWESYDETTGLQLSLVCGSSTAGVPVLQEPSHGQNQQLYLSPFSPLRDIF